MNNILAVPAALGKSLISAAAIPGFLTVAALSCITSAEAATYHIDFTIADQVHDYDTASGTTGTDTVHLTGEVVTSGFGTLDDVLLSWSFTIQDQNTINTISSEGLHAGSLGLVGTYGMGGLRATETGLFSSYNAWGFHEAIRESDDYFVGFVANDLGDLSVLDFRQYSGPRTGAFAEQSGIFTSDDPVLFGTTYNPDADPEPDQPSAVPLPAGLPMLIAGLGAFGFVRGRKSS
ncbi:MAG: VPLPA-CTERM sorting domain-containing protein [Paracoccaceae bacterium]